MGCSAECGPGKYSTILAVICWVPWVMCLTQPLLRTPLPYTPTLLPDNFTTVTTYSLLDAHADYGAFAYKESGDVAAVERNSAGQTRNSTISYKHRQVFVGVTCTYHVHSVVTGYESDGTPQGDVYPQLVAPGCRMAVGYRALLISMLLLPFLSSCVPFPHEHIREAAEYDRRYTKQLARQQRRREQEDHMSDVRAIRVGDIGVGGVAEGRKRRREGRPPVRGESPSSSRRSAPPPYDDEPASPGYTLDIPDLPESQPPVAEEGALLDVEPAADCPPPPSHTPPAYEQAALEGRPHRNRSVAHGSRLDRHRDDEAGALHIALRTAVIASLFAVVALTLSLGSIGCMFGYVNDSGFGEPRQLLWHVWLLSFTMAGYALVVVFELVCAFALIGIGATRYVQKEGASWRRLVRQL